MWNMAKLCRQCGIGIINPHFVGLEHLPLVFLKKLGLFQGKLIFSFHGADVRAMFLSTGFERRVLRYLLKNADALVCCSKGLGEELSLFAPGVVSRIEVVHNGVDVAHLLSTTDSGATFPEHFRGRKVIFNVGAYEFKKAHDVLLEAFAQLRSRRADVALAVAGQGSSGQAEKLAAKLGVGADVFFFENLPRGQVLGLLGHADLFVLSSRWKKGAYGEGFAMALLEAGAVGTPVVSTLSCGVAELIHDGETGWTVPVDDPEALAAALDRALNQPEAAARHAAQLKQRVSAEFTWERAFHRYCEIADAEAPSRN